MTKAFAVLAASTALAGCAHAWVPHGRPSSVCAYASGVSDGCFLQKIIAPKAGFMVTTAQTNNVGAAMLPWSSYGSEVTNFYNYATVIMGSSAAPPAKQTPARSWVAGPHPWPWNAPGVDYPVGAGVGANAPATDPADSVPSYCTYAANNGTLPNTLTCGSGYTGTMDIENYDFSGDHKSGGNGQCTHLVISSAWHPAAGSILLLRNNFFRNDQYCSQQGSAALAIVLIQGVAVAYPFEAQIIGNTFDGGAALNSTECAGVQCGPLSVNMAILLDQHIAGSLVMMFNSLLYPINLPTKVLGITTPTTTGTLLNPDAFTFVSRYNYYESLCGPVGCHGEAVAYNYPAPAGTTMHSTSFDRNTVLIPAVPLVSSKYQYESTDFMSTGTPTPAEHWGKMTFRKNVVVANGNGGQVTPSIPNNINAIGIGIAYNDYTTNPAGGIDASGNYLDPTNVNVCFVDSSGGGAVFGIAGTIAAGPPITMTTSGSFSGLDTGLLVGMSLLKTVGSAGQAVNSRITSIITPPVTPLAAGGVYGLSDIPFGFPDGSTFTNWRTNAAPPTTDFSGNVNMLDVTKSPANWVGVYGGPAPVCN